MHFKTKRKSYFCCEEIIIIPIFHKKKNLKSFEWFLFGEGENSVFIIELTDFMMKIKADI